MYIKRHIEKHVLKASSTFKVVYVGGPRQVGKTTMLRHLAESKGMVYVTLDNLEIRDFAQREPELFLREYKAPLLIDEVQYAPELFPYIKIKVDDSNENGLYWLTGSQHFSVIRNLQESLAGRVAIMSLHTLSMAEKEDWAASKDGFTPNVEGKEILQVDVFQHMLTGGFPALQINPDTSRELFFSSYTQTYIEKDLVSLFGIQKVSSFYKFLQLCADRTGQALVYSDLARDADISVNAAKEWTEILEASMQIFLLQPYSASFSKRIIKSPKIYFLDTGLASYLTGWNSLSSLRTSVYAGRLFETFVVSEILKSYLYKGLRPPLFYYRDKQGREVDLLIEKDQVLYPLEIKSGSRMRSSYLDSIVYLRERESRVGHAGIIMDTNRMYEASEGVSVLPVSTIR